MNTLSERMSMATRIATAIPEALGNATGKVWTPRDTDEDHHNATVRVYVRDGGRDLGYVEIPRHEGDIVDAETFVRVINWNGLTRRKAGVRDAITARMFP